jgi:DNA-binding MarR family transcriptional regulator
MRTSADEELAATGTAIYRGATLLASRARSERRGALSLNQTAVLGQLHKNGSMTPGEVGGRLRAQPQSLTRTFAALERERLIRRTPDPGDRRQALLTITGAGRRALAAELAPRARWIAAAVAATLTPAERELLVLAAGLMERLAAVDAGVAPVEP